MYIKAYFYISLRSVLIVFCAFILGNCNIVRLPEPLSADSGQATSSLEPVPLKSQPPYPIELKNDVESIYRKIAVSFSPGIAPKDYSFEIKRCLSFLVDNFGKPVYQGKISIHVTKNPSDNGKMAWSDKHVLDRTVTLNEFIFISDFELSVLVHEFFHAFYQTNSFIKGNPDFITEGLAVYAEYRFRYYDLTFEQILKIIRAEHNSLSSHITTPSFDFDRPFKSYSSKEIEYAYILAGLFFFSQDTNQINSDIRNILIAGQKYGSRKRFEDLISDYHLRVEKLFLAKVGEKHFNLPPPRKIETTDTAGGEKYYVQVATLEHPQSVKIIEEKMRQWGYQAITEQTRGNFVVYVGPYTTKEQAGSVRAQLTKRGDPDIRDPIVKHF